MAISRTTQIGWHIRSYIPYMPPLNEQYIELPTLPRQFACVFTPDPSAFLSPIGRQQATHSGHKGTSRGKAPWVGRSHGTTNWRGRYTLQY
jgi:hypothetical protein